MSVRYALLGLLALRPRHGYELRAAFEAMVGGEGNWDVKPAQIYASLTRLESAGWIEEVGVEKEAGPEKRVYALTEAGRAELDLWLQQELPAEHQRDGFFVKMMLALATGQANPRKLIRSQRGALYRRLHAVTESRRAADPKRQLAHILLLDKAVMHLEADLRWLDMIEARLDEVKRQPLPEPEPRPRGRPPRRPRLNAAPTLGSTPRIRRRALRSH
ncbi:MAG: PadR family transcriptional regulator [Chloroflexota bacterium]